MDAHITERIVSAQKRNDSEVEKPHGVRLGFMGHISLISEAILKISEECHSHPTLSILPFVECEEWGEFVLKSLQETKSRDTKLLGGFRAPAQMIDDDDALEGMDSQVASSEQFARFLCQQIVNDLPDNILFRDDNDDDSSEIISQYARMII